MRGIMARFCETCRARVDATGACACGGDGPTVALALPALARATAAPMSPGDPPPSAPPVRLDLGARTTRRTAIASIVVGVLLFGIVGLGTYLIASEVDSPGTSTAGTPVAASSADTSDSAETADPEAALQNRRQADRSELARGTGSWYPQISSKRVGTTVDGVTYDEAAVWRDFRASSAQHPEARLVWSGDWDSFRQGGYWVTVVDLPSASARSANQWCDRQGFPPDSCYAKRLSGTGGPDGNTVLRN